MSLVLLEAGKVLKSDYVYSNPAPGGVTVSDTQFALWIGSLIEDTGNWSMIQNGLEKISNAIRDSSIQDSTPGTYVVCDQVWNLGNRNHKFNVNEPISGVPGVPSSNAIAVYVGPLFRATPSASLTPNIKKASEVWREAVAKQSA